MMPLGSRRSCAVALIALALISRSQAQQFRSETAAVLVNVSVREGARSVRGLTAHDFEVRDNGTVQTVSVVAAESLPIDVTMTLKQRTYVNVALSATPRGEVQQEAIKRVVQTLRDIDRCRILASAPESIEDRPFESPPCRVDALPNPRWYAATARPIVAGHAVSCDSLYDALTLALISAPDSARQQLSLLLTDDWGTAACLFDSKPVLETARYSHAVLDVIVTPSNGARDDRTTHRKVETEIAKLTGGQLIVLQHGQDIGQAFLDALDDFRSSYVLGYVPTGIRRAGWHDISVKVVKSGAGRYTVAARKSYFGG